MTANVGRVGDIGIGACSAHKTTLSVTVMIVTGTPIVKAGGIDVANATSIGLSSCGHPTVVLTQSPIAKVGGAFAHRVGDIGALPGGSYVLQSGSPTFKSG